MKTYKCPKCESPMEAKSMKEAVCGECGYDHKKYLEAKAQGEKKSQEKESKPKKEHNSKLLPTLVSVVLILLGTGALFYGLGEPMPVDEKVTVTIGSNEVDTTCSAINYNHEDCKFRKANHLVLALSGGLFMGSLVSTRLLKED